MTFIKIKAQGKIPGPDFIFYVSVHSKDLQNDLFHFFPKKKNGK